MSGPQAILAVNAGSSSLKFALYPRHGDDADAAILSGNIEGLEPGGQPVLCLSGADGNSRRLLPATPGPGGFARALAALAEVLEEHAGDAEIVAIAHRIVHGGERYAKSVLRL